MFVAPESLRLMDYKKPPRAEAAGKSREPSRKRYNSPEVVELSGSSVSPQQPTKKRHKKREELHTGFDMTVADTPFQVPPRFIPVGKWLEKIDVHPLRGKGTKFHQFGQRLLEKRFLILDDLNGINEEHLKTMFTEDEMEMVDRVAFLKYVRQDLGTERR